MDKQPEAQQRAKEVHNEKGIGTKNVKQISHAKDVPEGVPAGKGGLVETPHSARLGTTGHGGQPAHRCLVGESSCQTCCRIGRAVVRAVGMAWRHKEPASESRRSTPPARLPTLRLGRRAPQTWPKGPHRDKTREEKREQVAAKDRRPQRRDESSGGKRAAGKRQQRGEERGALTCREEE